MEIGGCETFEYPFPDAIQFGWTRGFVILKAGLMSKLYTKCTADFAGHGGHKIKIVDD